MSIHEKREDVQADKTDQTRDARRSGWEGRSPRKQRPLQKQTQKYHSWGGPKLQEDELGHPLCPAGIKPLGSVGFTRSPALPHPR